MTTWLAVAREQNAVQAVHRDVFTVRDDAAVKTLVYCVYVCVSDTGCQQAVGGFLGVIAQIRQRNYSAFVSLWATKKNQHHLTKSASTNQQQPLLICLCVVTASF